MTHGFGARLARITDRLAARLAPTAGVTMVEYSFVLVLVSIIAVSLVAAIGGHTVNLLDAVRHAFD
jgi:Flp pilus assembly pilin Flp